MTNEELNQRIHDLWRLLDSTVTTMPVYAPTLDCYKALLKEQERRSTEREVPKEGMVLVPKEPTEEMLGALTDRMWKDHTVMTVWKAMIEAA